MQEAQKHADPADLDPVSDPQHCKKRIYLQTINDSLYVVIAIRLRQWEYRHMGCSAMAQYASEFLVVLSTSKKTPPFLGPKCCNRFFSNLKHESKCT